MSAHILITGGARSGKSRFAESVTLSLGSPAIYIATAEARDAEIARLDKEIARITKDKTAAEGKISNEKFVANAPADVVQKQRDRIVELTSALEQLNDKKSRIQAI